MGRTWAVASRNVCDDLTRAARACCRCCGGFQWRPPPDLPPALHRRHAARPRHGIAYRLCVRQIWNIDGQSRVLDKLLARRKKKRGFEYEVK